MLTTKQRIQLKSMANSLVANYQVGKNEITETSVEMLDKALTAHELIKVSVLKSATALPMEISLDLASLLHAEVVQLIGRVVVLYRRNHKKPVIQLV